jgi:hypothetical protein
VPVALARSRGRIRAISGKVGSSRDDLIATAQPTHSRRERQLHSSRQRAVLRMRCTIIQQDREARRSYG